MNVLDVIIVMAAAAAALGGYRLGLMARAFSWIGLALGIFVAARLLPTVIEQVQGPDDGTRLLLAAALLMAGAFVGQGIGLLIGARAHALVPHGPLKQVDRMAGAAVGVLGVVIGVWLLLPAMADVPGWASQQARGSAVARAIDRSAPPAPDTLQTLRRLVGEGSFPKVFDSLRPTPESGPPPADSGLPAEVVRRVSASTVKVEGEACRRIQEGSGFAAGADTVVTNAHVVAGVRRPHVERLNGRRLAATVVVFDSRRDLAVLRVPGLGQEPLPIANAREGQSGAVFGHPGGQDALRVSPARINERVQAVGRDLYDQSQTRRDVFILAAALQPGDSGGALADASGSVVGVAFAIAPDRPGTSYALTSAELRAVLSLPRASGVSTGPCLTNA